MTVLALCCNDLITKWNRPGHRERELSQHPPSWINKNSHSLVRWKKWGVGKRKEVYLEVYEKVREFEYPYNKVPWKAEHMLFPIFSKGATWFITIHVRTSFNLLIFYEWSDVNHWDFDSATSFRHPTRVNTNIAHSVIKSVGILTRNLIKMSQL